MIWLSLVYPVLALLVLAIFFNKKLLGWEYMVVFGVPALLICILQWSVNAGMTSDKEWWGSYLIQANYYEDWDEEVTYTETYACGTDSKGNTEYCTRTATRIDYHPAYWTAEDNISQEFSIDQTFYQQLVKRFANEKFIELHRDYDSNDGDMYITNYPNDDEIMYPVVTRHQYVNKVAASSSVFKFPPADTSLPHFDYPPIVNLQSNPVLTFVQDIPEITKSRRSLSIYNGKWGAAKQIRIMVLIFKNQPLTTLINQENYWKGANKNEFVVMMSVDDSLHVQCAHVTSWTEIEALKINVRNFVADQKVLDLMAVTKYVEDEAFSSWKRKRFRDFDYLTIDPPLWSILVAHGLSIILVGFLSFWVVVNDATNEPRRNWRNY